jgi:hypothetical protein
VYLVYKPEGSDEPQRFKYHPQKLMSAEREMLERRTARDFSDFTKAVINGNSAARRALLFMYLKREHPTTKYEDVDFAWDELTLEYSKGEYLKMREDAVENLHGDQLAAALQQIDAEIETAYDDVEAEGKARRPIAE